ncbi:hypothetical protein SNEBB_000782 [Seison nebaliae]|nr:hypothetical protein SNEBB_000782 [Seison nebaliae]
MTTTLKDADPQMYEIMMKEKMRQKNGLELISSENFASRAVLEAQSSCFSNKYSEGTIGNRYYGGTEFVDEMESLVKERALSAFHLDGNEWKVNVQSLSGTPANFAVYTALVGVHGRIMGLDLSDGGHLSHGFYNGNKKISATSIFFESMPYKRNLETEEIDYEWLEDMAMRYRPTLIIAGISCYSRNLDYKKFKEIATKSKSILMADMSHVSGLVAAKLVNNPFDYCDVITTTTHKTLRGPRAAIIFSKNEEISKKIDFAVFPGLQGGPHNHTISAIGVALKEVMSDEWKVYARKVIDNSRFVCEKFIEFGYHIVTGGTDTHQMLLNLKNKGTDGAKVEFILELCQIAVNKNTCPGDKSALKPSGIRIGTSALTSRKLEKNDFGEVARFVHEAIELTLRLQDDAAKANTGDTVLTTKKFKEFVRSTSIKEIEELKGKVNEFAKQFFMPGFDEY